MYGEEETAVALNTAFLVQGRLLRNISEVFAVKFLLLLLHEYTDTRRRFLPSLDYVDLLATARTSRLNLFLSSKLESCDKYAYPSQPRIRERLD